MLNDFGCQNMFFCILRPKLIMNFSKFMLQTTGYEDFFCFREAQDLMAENLVILFFYFNP